MWEIELITANSSAMELHFFSEGESHANTMKRAACQVIAFLMPEEGLDEALDALTGIREFHTEKSARPALPKRTALRRQSGVMLRPTTRPALAAPEE